MKDDIRELLKRLIATVKKQRKEFHKEKNTDKFLYLNGLDPATIEGKPTVEDLEHLELENEVYLVDIMLYTIEVILRREEFGLQVHNVITTDNLGSTI